MRIAVFLTVAVMTAVVSGCTARPAPPVPSPSFADCPAAVDHFTARIGQVLQKSVPFEPHRVLTPNSMMTMDHNPGRLNVYINNDGLITDARCG